MQLRQQGNPVAGQPVKQIDLPQRPGPIHRVNCNPGDLLLEFTNSSGSRHTELAYVEVQVHFAVQPLRVRDTERHSGKAPAQRRQQVQPRSDQFDDVVTGHQVLSLRALSKMTRLETFSVVRASSVARKNASRLV